MYHWCCYPLLQDVDIATDPADNCALYIIAHHRTKSQVRRRPALSARFLFIDHIRCLATKQNLIRHKESLRHTKMALIANMLGLPPPSDLAPHNSPRPVILAPPTDSIDSSPAPPLTPPLPRLALQVCLQPVYLLLPQPHTL